MEEMAEANASKRHRHFQKADNDRISKLPDSILCYILSFVPTKYSVQTSILSRRWRFTWTSVSVLDLDDSLFQSGQSCKNFVNMVLVLHSHPSCVQRFSLNLRQYSYPTSDINLWIWAAITHNVQELHLSMNGTIKLPRALFNSETLVVLKLTSGIDLDVPESVSLPSLKVVHFQAVKSLCDASINRILSGSPILEKLMINRIYTDGVNIFLILSSSLKTLVIKTSRRSNNHYKVVVDAPKLVKFELYDGRNEIMVDGIEFKNASSILKSVVRFPHLDCTRAPDQIWKTTCSMYGISNVKVLICPLSMLKTQFSDAKIHFNNLTRLLVNYCGNDLSTLPQILTKLPNLELLILEKMSNCNHTIKCEAWEPEKSDEISCLKCSFKRLLILGFEANEGEMQMVEYFLENARVLNEIRLVRKNSDPKESAFLKKLLTNPRCSNGFKIIIS